MASDFHDDPDSERRASEATAWFLRLKEPTVTYADHRLFRRWLAHDPQNRQAYNEISRLWSDLETPAAMLAEDGWHRAITQRPRPAFVRRSAAYVGTLAACFALIAIVAIWRDAGLIDRMRADYATSPGERREIAFVEGSRAYLDGGTALTVKFEKDERRIRLLRGRVWFDVAPDRAAPFTVTTDSVETRVLGTAFGVDWESNDIGVTVERGLVEVSTADGPAVQVPAGEQVRTIGGRLQKAVKVDPETALAWRRGLIVLDQAPLGRVVDELERMKPGRVMITDRSLRDLTLSGVFRADDPDAVVEALRSALGLKTLSVPGFATLVYR